MLCKIWQFKRHPKSKRTKPSHSSGKSTKLALWKQGEIKKLQYNSYAECLIRDIFCLFRQSQGIHDHDTTCKSFNFKVLQEQDILLFLLRMLSKGLITRSLSCNMIFSQLRKFAQKQKKFAQLRSWSWHLSKASLDTRLGLLYFHRHTLHETANTIQSKHKSICINFSHQH